MIGDSADDSFPGSTLHKVQCSKSHLRSMENVKVVLKLKKVILLISIPAAHDKNSSLQQHDLSGYPLLQDQQEDSQLLKLHYAKPCFLL